MTDTITSPAVEWTTSDSRPQPVPVIETSATVDGFKVSASNDSGWRFSAMVRDVFIVAIGNSDYYNPRSDEQLASAQAAAIAAVGVLRGVGAIPV